MAENKRSFLLYTDLIYMVGKLTDEQAGQLFKHILDYVNDKDPVTDNILIEVAFEPIKQSLKRDLRKYEERREKNKENAEKRWHKDNAIGCDRIQSDAKDADSDSDNDNDSVNDSVIDIVKVKKYNNIPPSLEEIKLRIEERGIKSFTAEGFHAFYESKGWKVGSSRMKNWDAALTTWNNRDSVTQPARPTQGPKYKNYDEMCQAALTNSDIWKQMQAVRLPDMPKPVWAHPNDVVKYNLTKYLVK